MDIDFAAVAARFIKALGEVPSALIHTEEANSFLIEMMYPEDGYVKEVLVAPTQVQLQERASYRLPTFEFESVQIWTDMEI